MKTLAGGVHRLLRGGSAAECGEGGSVTYRAPNWSAGGPIAYLADYSCANVVGEVSGFSELGVLGKWSGKLPSGAGAEGGPFSAVWAPDGRALAYSEEFDGVGARVAISRLPNRVTTRLRGRWYVHGWQPLCTVRGGSRGDRIRARATADLVCGFRGDDRIDGGAGEDRLFGEEGNDRFRARDGEFDVVGCGPGRDTVYADARDLAGADCERVVRR